MRLTARGAAFSVGGRQRAGDRGAAAPGRRAAASGRPARAEPGRPSFSCSGQPSATANEVAIVFVTPTTLLAGTGGWWRSDGRIPIEWADRRSTARFERWCCASRARTRGGATSGSSVSCAAWGVTASATTVRAILKAAGLGPAGEAPIPPGASSPARAGAGRARGRLLHVETLWLQRLYVLLFMSSAASACISLAAPRNRAAAGSASSPASSSGRSASDQRPLASSFMIERASSHATSTPSSEANSSRSSHAGLRVFVDHYGCKSSPLDGWRLLCESCAGRG
jgi:hypothetical protein